MPLPPGACTWKRTSRRTWPITAVSRALIARKANSPLEIDSLETRPKDSTARLQGPHEPSSARR